MEVNNILRVISGIAKGHRLKTLKGDATRPTSDRVKEALFSIIINYIQDAQVLDLFAGTGSLGIEALSRGAKSAVFIDKNEHSVRIIKENLLNTRLTEYAQVIKGEALASLKMLSLKNKEFSLVFLDPPYNKDIVLDTIKALEYYNLLKEDGIIIVEKDIKDEVPVEIGKISLKSQHKYGDTMLLVYRE